jgi:hypothetical protein
MKRLARWSFALAIMSAFGCKGASYSTAPTAKAGSLARFVVHRDRMYALNQSDLMVYETTADGSLRFASSTYVRGDAETLFPYEELLFVGTREGMLVYSLVDPIHPAFVGQARHVYSCDPVVVQQDVAYVTLRSGSACREGVDGLLVFDVSNPTAPREVARRPMASPRGLGVDGDVLFVADEQEGLVVYDLEKPHHPRRVGSVPSISGYDVIAHDGILYLSAESGLYQYAYDSQGISRPHPLSRIPIGSTRAQ